MSVFVCVCVETGVWVWSEGWEESGAVWWNKRCSVGLGIRVCVGDTGVFVCTHAETGVCVQRRGYDCGWSNSGVEGEMDVSICVCVRRDWGVGVQGERGGMCRENEEGETDLCVCVKGVVSEWRERHGSVKGETRVCVSVQGDTVL